MSLRARPARTLAPAALLAALLAACATPHFSVDEAMRFEDGTTRFVAFAQKQTGWVLRGVPDVEVEFQVEGEEVARAVTDERGFAKAIVQVPPAERFEATAEWAGRSFRGDAELIPWRSDRVIIACDIDATISETSLGALFFDELDLLSQPIESSPEVLTEIHDDYHVIYVTARPRFTLHKTREWLKDHGYPKEPVVTSLTVRDMLGQTTYKTRTLRAVRKHYTNLLIGIGNTDIDANSYGTQGMLVVLHQPDQPVHRDGNVFHFQSWQQIGEFFRANRDVLRSPERLRAALLEKQELVIPALSPEASRRAPGAGRTDARAAAGPPPGGRL